MARGKHGASAAARHAIEGRDAEIERYQKRVAALTSEVQDLKQRVTHQQSVHSREVRRLKAERDQGLSPEIAVMQAEVRRAKEQSDLARRECEGLRKRWHAIAGRLHTGLSLLGLTFHEASEFVVAVISEDGLDNAVLVVDTDLQRFGPKNTEMIERLMRARGQRA